MCRAWVMCGSYAYGICEACIWIMSVVFIACIVCVICACVVCVLCAYHVCMLCVSCV